MAKDTSYPGHDEGTQKPTTAPTGYNSPASHLPLTQEPHSVNVKTDQGTK